MNRKYVLFMAFLTVLLTLKINIVEARSKPHVLPPSSEAFDKTYQEWTAAWLQWAVSIPAASNPMNDLTGTFAAIGQSGKVWFLAGTLGPSTTPVTPVVRSISIPKGTALFFPLVNYFWINTPEYGDPLWSPTQEAFARDTLATSIDTANGLSLRIDGRSVPNLSDYRFKSTAAECSIPPLATDNIFQADLVNNPYHCVADGYWVLLPPLSVGSHTIRFTGGVISPSPFSLDVTYKIKVKPEHKIEMPLHP